MGKKTLAPGLYLHQKHPTIIKRRPSQVPECSIQQTMQKNETPNSIQADKASSWTPNPLKNPQNPPNESRQSKLEASCTQSTQCVFSPAFSCTWPVPLTAKRTKKGLAACKVRGTAPEVTWRVLFQRAPLILRILVTKGPALLHAHPTSPTSMEN